ncbi:hypothetical protein D3C87_1557890 [compost metagenome]
MQLQLIHQDGGAQFALDEAPMALVAQHVRVKRHHAAASTLLALVEGEIGNGDQLIGVVAVERGQRHPDRGREARHAAGDIVRLAQLAQQPLAQPA